MGYTATKNGITKVISKNVARDYIVDGWTVFKDNVEQSISDYPNPLTNNTISSDPYDYDSVTQNKLKPVIINTESFDNYSSFFCINTKTYVTTPERTMDGSMPDINNIDTFVVPRFKIKFDKMSISDFRRMLKAIQPNEFIVQYYDYETNKDVTHSMYIEPREMAEIYNIGYEILDILGCEFSFIGTLNDLKQVRIRYYNADNTLWNIQEVPYGTHLYLQTGQYVNAGNGHFVNWNTNQERTGQTYYPFEEIIATEDLDLYAVVTKTTFDNVYIGMDSKYEVPYLMSVNDGVATALTTPITLNEIRKLEFTCQASDICYISIGTGLIGDKKNDIATIYTSYLATEDITQYLQDNCYITLWADD